MEHMGHKDLFNVRRRLYSDDAYDYDESNEDDRYEEYDALDDTYFDDGDEYQDTYDEADDAMESTYGDVMKDDGYDFNGEFEYGDMLGYRLWAKDKMAANEFECLNCDEEDVFGAHVMENGEELNQASDYSFYGDFMYYFDEHLFDFANDEDWKSNNGDLSKCSVAIPGLHHKLCVDHDNGEYQVRFAAASSDEMDDTYYQLYGYDEYYYNNVLDDYADYTTDHDYAYDESDSGYYEEAMRQISQRRQLSSEEEFDEVFEVPRGYDEEEYGDGNNGYDEQHAMQGVAEERAEARRAYLDEMSAREEKRKKDKEAEFERLKKLETQEREKEEGETLYTPPHPYAPPHPGVNPQQTMYQQPPQHPGAKPQPIMYQQHPQAPQWQQRRRALYDYDYAYDGIDDEYHTTNDEDEYTDYFSEYYGMNDEDNYYYIQQDMQAHELLDHLQSELGDLLLSLEDNTNWDEITDINDHEDALHHTQHSLRKCKTLQSVQICATMHHNDAITDGVKVNLKVGRHKYHRSPFYQSAAYQDMMDEMREFNRDDATEEEFDYDMNIDKAAKNTLQDMHWAVDHNIMDVAEDEWNDPLQFKPSHHMTYNGHQIIRKCKATFCLCQYINNAYEGTQIHPCKPTIKADKAEILGPADLLNLVNVMDSFLAPVHVVRRIPTINIIHHPMIPPPVTFNGVPMLQRLPYAHILRLRAIPPRSMFIHPFRGRKFQNPITYRRHKHRIPWHKYQPFAKLMPPKKPQWLPQWIWQEVRHKMTQSIKPKAANKEMEDYYDYDEHLADYYDDLDNKQGQGTRRASSYDRYSGGDDDDYAGNDEGGDNNNRASDDDDDQYDAYYDDYDANNPPPKYSDDDSQLYNNAMDGEFMDNALNYRRLIGDYYDYDEEDEDADREEEDEIMDGWIDEYDGDEWVIVDDGADSFVEDNFGFLDYEDDSIWDEIMMNIETLKGNSLDKKCMKIFGRKLCLCEFIDWVNGKEIGGNTKHVCYPSAHKPSAVTKKTMKQIQTAVLEKALQKEKKEIKEEERNNVLKRINAEPNRIPLNTKRNDKQIKTHKVKVDKMAQQKVEKGHSQIMKRLSPSAPTRSHVHTHSGLPAMRPVWLPHYFWHWLHHFKRSKRLHSNDRIPWISSAADVNGDVRQMYDEYETYDDAYDAYIEAAANYWKAYVEYNEAVNEYDETMNENDEVFLYDADDENINYNEQNEYNQYEYEHQNAYTEADDNTYEFDKSYNLYSYATDGSDEQFEESASVQLNVLSRPMENNTNPYWVFELVFLFVCVVVFGCLMIHGHQQKWIETIKRKNLERINTRKYGFNRINVVFDTEDDDSDCSIYSDESVMISLPR
eukprot:817341_1